MVAIYKFQLHFDPQKSPTYNQYKNLIKWFEDRGIQYKFEWEFEGQFYPNFVLLEDDHALLFKLFFKTIPVEK